jgi:hypothetical protein
MRANPLPSRGHGGTRQIGSPIATLSNDISALGDLSGGVNVARNFAVQERFREAHIDRFGVRVHGAGEYPEKLRDAAHPVELIYYQGWWDLVNSRSVAVVGTRKPTPDGLNRTRQLVRKLVEDGFTVVSVSPRAWIRPHDDAGHCVALPACCSMTSVSTAVTNWWWLIPEIRGKPCQSVFGIRNT